MANFSGNLQKPTRKSLPVLHITGSYYEVGYETGRVFGQRIKRFAKKTKLQLESSRFYDSGLAEKVYATAAKIVQTNFPQFWEELWGMADGSQIDFHELFTLYLVDVLDHENRKRKLPLFEVLAADDKDAEQDAVVRPSPALLARRDSKTVTWKIDVEEEEEEEDADEVQSDIAEEIEETADSTRGCSDVLVNVDGVLAIGHTEDLQADLMNECYVTHVHYQDSSEEPRGKLKRTEEQIVSYCYPGDLPGYAMAVSEHLAVTVNELASLEIDPWGTPKGILARAALSCNSVEEMVEILTDKGHGISSGLSFNVMTLSEPKRRLFNIEVACRERDPEGNFLPDRQSRVSVHEVKENEVFFHCNLFQRIPVKPYEGAGASSECRLRVLTNNYPQPTSIDDLRMMLSDDSDHDYPVFREKGAKDKAKTAAISIYDGVSNEWTIFGDKATNDSALKLTLPLVAGP